MAFTNKDIEETRVQLATIIVFTTEIKKHNSAITRELGEIKRVRLKDSALITPLIESCMKRIRVHKAAIESWNDKIEAMTNTISLEMFLQIQ